MPDGNTPRRGIILAGGSGTRLYAPQSEYTLACNDPTVAIQWPLDGIEPIISAKDAIGLTLADVPVFS